LQVVQERSFDIRSPRSRFKLQVYSKTQDPVVLKEAASRAVYSAFEEYSMAENTADTPKSTNNKPQNKWDDEEIIAVKTELDLYLLEARINFESDILVFWHANRMRYHPIAFVFSCH
jgi:hypothetical protein